MSFLIVGLIITILFFFNLPKDKQDQLLKQFKLRKDDNG